MIYFYLGLIVAGGFVLKNQKGKNIQTCLNIHYSYLFAFCAIITTGLLLQQNFIQTNLKHVFILGMISTLFSLIFLKKHQFNARRKLDKILKIILFISAVIGILITFVTLFAILSEAIKFFKLVNFIDFILGTKWNPQVAHDDSISYAKSFGALPIIIGTILIATVAILIATPLGIMSAIYLVEYCSKKNRNIVKPILEVLAGIPTVVYGYFAIIFITPLLKNIGLQFGFNIPAESALSAGIVMGIMIIPFISSLSDDAIKSVPNSLRENALALGSTKSEMIRKVVLVEAFPNIISAILLAISRAIGETMIVVMAAGLSANLTFNPLEAVTTATVQIVTLLTGDQEAGSVVTLAAFGLSLVLFFMTLILNIIALIIMKKSKT